MIDKIFDIARKEFDYCEVVEIKKTERPVDFSAGILKSMNVNERHGFAIRGVKDGKIAFSSTTKPNSERELVDQTLASIPFSQKMDFDFAGKPGSIPGLKITDNRISQMTNHDKIELGEKTVDRLSKLHNKAQVACDTSTDEMTIAIRTTNGFQDSYVKDTMGFGAGVKLVEGENMLTAYSMTSKAEYVDDTDFMLSDVERLFKWGMKNVTAKSGKYKVLFTPSAVTHIVGILKASWSGKSVYKRISPWMNKVGDKIADEMLSIYDDATIDGLANSCPFDSEGTPTQRTPIIENGVLKGFIADRATAKKLSISPTGNGFKRSGMFGMKEAIDAIPVTASSTSVIAPGKKHSDDILAGIDEGVLVDGMLGTMMGNAFSGMLSGNIALGYYIKDGQVVGRIKDAMLTVNLFSAIKDSIAEISSDASLQLGWSGHCLIPWMLLDGCTVVLK